MRRIAVLALLLTCCQSREPEVVAVDTGAAAVPDTGALAVTDSVAAADTPAKPGAVAKPLLERIAVIGSSASAGWNTNVALHDALEAQVLAPHAPIVNYADATFFLDPGAMGERQIDSARAHAPSLVVALDFLFWFGYGEVALESERLENLEFGLELLDTLDCPLLISRFPDMSPAIGKMLMATQMPQAQTLVQLNARTLQWAATRQRVVFVPMSELLDQLRDGAAVNLAELRFQGLRDQRRLLQSDNLHPTAEGVGVLARLCIDTLSAAPFALEPAAFKTELAPSLAALLALDRERAAQARAQGKNALRPPLERK